MKSLSKKEWIAVMASVGFVAYAMFGGTIMNLFSQNMDVNNLASISNSDFKNNSTPSPTQVGVQDLVVGTGTSITPGMVVNVNYVLRLNDGTVIQNSKEVNAGKPFGFVYGAGQLIPGWEMGVNGMRVGGKRIIVIPPELGYGDKQVGPIPANATLIFEIEVVSAENLPKPQ